jgi:AcrR family transcriptional regulator
LSGKKRNREKEPKRTDARVERTREALVQAFVALFFERPYDRITVGAIVARAGVGRSTFYEHFVDKEDVLAASVRAPLAPLAAAVDDGAPIEPILQVMDHFAANGDQARALLAGSARRAMTRVLASMVEARLATRRGQRVRRGVSIALSEAMIGSIGTWLRGESGCGAREIAEALHAMARRGASG